MPTKMTPWPNPNTSRRFAAINSFGFGGANATMILEEAPNKPTNQPANQQTSPLRPFCTQSAGATRYCTNPTRIYSPNRSRPDRSLL
ncbi:hypothetical protein KFU94_69875 [Chloroflexi bacterium TSY]|nr:hypothetical protein [Chloroflexi bacterium TSY]